MITQQPFDPARKFETRTFFRFDGDVYERGVPFPAEGKTAAPSQLRLLYDNRKIGFTDPTDNDLAGELAPVTLTDQGGGWWAVDAPWLDEPEKVQGRDPALFRAQQLRDEGEPDDHHGVVIVPKGGGWFTVNAEWLAAPESYQGRDKAYERATALRKEGAPPEAPAGTAGAPEGPAGGEAALTDDVIAARVKALVDGNTLDKLQTLADGLEGASEAKTKGDFAALIVAAGRDQNPEGQNGGAA